MEVVSIIFHWLSPCLTANQGHEGPSSSSRRTQVLQYIIDTLQKLAATRDVAVVVLTQCATRIQAGLGPTLVPAITSNAWEQGIFTRLVLFRDWSTHHDRATGLHFAGAQKVNGKSQDESVENVTAFTIESVSELPAARTQSTCPPPPLFFFLTGHVRAAWLQQTVTLVKHRSTCHPDRHRNGS